MKFLNWQIILCNIEDGTYPTEIGRKLKLDQNNVFNIIEEMERERILEIKIQVRQCKKFVYLTDYGVKLKNHFLAIMKHHKRNKKKIEG